MDSKTKTAIETASKDDHKIRHVTLDFPITRGDQVIAKIMLRKPAGAALKGISLAALVNSADYDQYRLLIPRISEPAISTHDIDEGLLDPADLIQITAEVTDFFIPASARI